MEIKNGNKSNEVAKKRFSLIDFHFGIFLVSFLRRNIISYLFGLLIFSVGVVIFYLNAFSISPEWSSLINSGATNMVFSLGSISLLSNLLIKSVGFESLHLLSIHIIFVCLSFLYWFFLIKIIKLKKGIFVSLILCVLLMLILFNPLNGSSHFATHTIYLSFVSLLLFNVGGCRLINGRGNQLVQYVVVIICGILGFFVFSSVLSFVVCLCVTFYFIIDFARTKELSIRKCIILLVPVISSILSMVSAFLFFNLSQMKPVVFSLSIYLKNVIACISPNAFGSLTKWNYTNALYLPYDIVVHAFVYFFAFLIITLSVICIIRMFARKTINKGPLFLIVSVFITITISSLYFDITSPAVYYGAGSIYSITIIYALCSYYRDDPALKKVYWRYPTISYYFIFAFISFAIVFSSIGSFGTKTFIESEAIVKETSLMVELNGEEKGSLAYLSGLLSYGKK